MPNSAAARLLAMARRLVRFEGPAVERARSIFKKWVDERFGTQSAAAKAMGMSQSTLSGLLAQKQGIGTVLISYVAQIDPEVAIDMLGGSLDGNGRVDRILDQMTAQASDRHRRAIARIALLLAPAEATDTEVAHAADGLIVLSAAGLRDAESSPVSVRRTRPAK
jgi:hypothetical protein